MAFNAYSGERNYPSAVAAGKFEKIYGSFSKSKVKKYKKYRENFYRWMNNWYAKHNNKNFSKAFKKNIKFLLKHYKPLMMEDAGVKNYKISDGQLIKKLYKKMQTEKVKTALTKDQGVIPVIHESSGALGKVFGGRKSLEEKFKEVNGKGDSNSTQSSAANI